MPCCDKMSFLISCARSNGSAEMHAGKASTSSVAKVTVMMYLLFLSLQVRGSCSGRTGENC